MIKRVIIWVVATCMVIALAACSGEEGGKKEASKQPGTQVAEVVLAVGKGGWEKSTPETVAENDGAALRLKTPKAKFEYQIMSSVIPVVAGTEYRLDYDIQVTEGKMQISAYDPGTAKHINIVDISGPGSLAFKAVSDKVQVIVAAGNAEAAGPAACKIDKIAVMKP